MNDSVMTELRVVVERAVRPVRANNLQKRRMREEILGHLVGIYQEEAGRHDNEQAALEHARQRFGDPRELAEELWKSMPKRDRLGWALDTMDYRQGGSLLRLAIRHVLWMSAAMTVVLLVGLSVRWIFGELDGIGLFLYRTLVFGMATTGLMFVFAVFSERIGRALYERESEGSIRAAALYCLASLFVYPTIMLFVGWGVSGDLASGLAGFWDACVIATVAPVLFFLRGRQVADEIREEESWASLEVEE